MRAKRPKFKLIVDLILPILTLREGGTPILGCRPNVLFNYSPDISKLTKLVLVNPSKRTFFSLIENSGNKYKRKEND